MNKPLILMEFHPEKCERRRMTALAVYRNTLALGYSARLLQAGPHGYRLLRAPDESVGHRNILFADGAHLAELGELRRQWDEAA